MPQELSTLTAQLEDLNLLQNYARGGDPARKMRVTQQGCSFLLKIKALEKLYLDITMEEDAALAGFKADMCKHGRTALELQLTRGFRFANKQDADAS